MMSVWGCCITVGSPLRLPFWVCLGMNSSGTQGWVQICVISDAIFTWKQDLAVIKTLPCLHTASEVL